MSAERTGPRDISVLESHADFYGLHMHRSDRNLHLWLKAIHEAAEVRMLHDREAYARHIAAKREAVRNP